MTLMRPPRRSVSGTSRAGASALDEDGAGVDPRCRAHVQAAVGELAVELQQHELSLTQRQRRERIEYGRAARDLLERPSESASRGRASSSDEILARGLAAPAPSSAQLVQRGVATIENNQARECRGDDPGAHAHGRAARTRAPSDPPPPTLLAESEIAYRGRRRHILPKQPHRTTRGVEATLPVAPRTSLRRLLHRRRTRVRSSTLTTSVTPVHHTMRQRDRRKSSSGPLTFVGVGEVGGVGATLDAHDAPRPGEPAAERLCARSISIDTSAVP